MNICFGASRARRPSGFTLIELLTVIAIIGILAAIIIPVVGTVRESAKKSQCTSNLRQVMTSMFLYTAEHKNQFPTAQRPVESGGTSRWTKDLDPYLPLTVRTGTFAWEHPVFICPSAVNPDGKSGNDLRLTYAASAALYGPPGTDSDRDIPRLVSAIANPASTPLVYDAKFNTATNTQTDYFHNWNKVSADVARDIKSMQVFDMRHRDKLNLAFADGSVRTVGVDYLRDASLTERRWRGLE